MVNVAQLAELPVVVRTVVGSSPIVHPMYYSAMASSTWHASEVRKFVY